MKIMYEICNTGCSETFDTLEDAREEMKKQGYVDVNVSCTVYAGRDEDGAEVYEDAEYFVEESLLPDNWRDMCADDLLSANYGYGYEPCIHPRVDD